MGRLVWRSTFHGPPLNCSSRLVSSARSGQSQVTRAEPGFSKLAKTLILRNKLNLKKKIIPQDDLNLARLCLCIEILKNLNLNI